MADVFISYSRKDKDFVRRLDEALKSRQREAWVDWEGIRPTEEFMQAIYHAIEAADTFVFVLTPDSVGSVVCGREIAHAAAHNKRLVPLVRRDVDAAKVPEALAKLNWIFCRDSDGFEQAIETLITALGTDLEWIHSHTRLLTRAIEWESKGKNNSFVLRGVDLRTAEQWLAQAGTDKERQPTALQTEYIIASRKAAAQRQRMLLGGVTAALILTIALGILALIQRQLAVKREGEVRRTFSRSDFFRADELVTGQKRQEALAFLARAIRTDSNNHAAGRRMVFLFMQHPWFVPQQQVPSVPGAEHRFALPAQPVELNAAVAAKIANLVKIPDDGSVKDPQARVKKILQDAVFSPDGQKVAVRFGFGKIYVFDTATGDELVAHDSPAHQLPDEPLRDALCFSPDSSHLVAVGGSTNEYGNNGSVLILGMDQDSKPQEFRLKDVVYGPEFSPDGQYFLFYCDGTDQLWRIDGDRLATFVHTDPQSTTEGKVRDSSYWPDGESIQFRPDGGHIRLGSTLCEKTTREPITKVPGEEPADAVDPDNRQGLTNGLLAETSDGRLSAAKEGNGSVKIVDAKSRKNLTLACTGTGAERAEFTPDGRELIVTSKDGKGCVWRTESGEPVGKFLFAPGWHSGVMAAARDSFVVVSGEQSNSAQILDVTTLKPVGTPLEHRATIFSCEFSADGSRILTGSKDHTVRTWDSRTGKPLIDPVRLANRDNVAYFAADGSFFITESGDGAGPEVHQVWDTDTGRALSEQIERDMDEDQYVGVHSYLSQDGHGLVVELSGDEARSSYVCFEIPPADRPVPAWLADLAEALGGLRVTDNNTLEWLTADQRTGILHRIAATVAADHTDQWSAIAYWLLDHDKNAAISPSSRLSVEQYIKRRVAEDTIFSLELAAKARQDDPQIFRRLAAKYFEHARSEPNNWFAKDASLAWMNLRRAVALAPDNEGIKKSVAEMLNRDIKARAQSAKSPDVRRVAVRELARSWKNDPETLPFLKARAESDQTPGVRSVAVEELARGWKDGPETLPFVKARAQSDQASLVRRFAVRELAYGWRDDPETLPFLKACAQSDPAPDVRSAAIGELAHGWKNDPETLPFLKACAQSDPAPLVRRATVEELARSWKDNPAVEKLLNDLKAAAVER